VAANARPVGAQQQPLSGSSDPSELAGVFLHSVLARGTSRTLLSLGNQERVFHWGQALPSFILTIFMYSHNRSEHCIEMNE
jgi:hypothetical protein